MKKNQKDHLSVPKQVELFGRVIKTVYDPQGLTGASNLGEARYGVNHIAITQKVKDIDIDPNELKLTYLHEMLHFILSFTNYDSIIRNNERIDIEQFIELMAAGIFQYEKSAKY